MELKLQSFFEKIVVWSPLILILWLTCGVTISFLIAYFTGSVTIYMPFISETGAMVPEMNIFSTTLIFGSFIGAIIVLYRYGIVRKMITHENNRIRKLNDLGVIIGVISMAGMAGVAAFPMSSVLTVHLIFAGIHFGLATVYLFIQTYISLRVKSPFCSRFTGILRFILSVVNCLILLLLVITLPIAYVKWDKAYPERRKATKTPNDEAFGVLFASAMFEWLFCSTFLTFTFTFIKEFRKFKPRLSVEGIKNADISENVPNNNS